MSQPWRIETIKGIHWLGMGSYGKMENYGRALALRTLNPQTLKGFSHLRKKSLYPQQKITPTPPTPEVLPFPPLPVENDLSLSAKPAVTFPEGDARRGNKAAPHGTSIAAFRSITRISMSIQHCLKTGVKVCLNSWLKHSSKDCLLKRSWSCLISLGLVLTSGF